MLSKRKRVEDPYEQEDESKRLALNVQDLYGANHISARRAHSLLSDARAAGVGLGNLSKPVRHGSHNAARNFRNAFFNTRLWPDVYMCRVRVWNKARCIEEVQWVGMHLIHEIVEMIAKFGLPAVYLSTELMDPASRAELDRACLLSGEPSLLGLGLHGDGVPCNWDRSESCEVLSLNLPGVGGKWRNMRIPLFVLHHSMMSSGTWDDIMAIQAWSLRYCLLGVWPKHRHDGSPWLPGRDCNSDFKRAKKGGDDLKLKSICCEIRGDWKFKKESFHLPQWNEEAGICWSCNCTPGEVSMGSIAM